MMHIRCGGELNLAQLIATPYVAFVLFAALTAGVRN